MKTVITFLLLGTSLSGLACDNCNVYLNVTPNDNQHSIGLYYRQRLMMGHFNPIGQQTLTKHASHGNDPAFWGNQIKETYRTFELRGSFLWAKRWRTYFVLPYTLNSQYINNEKRYTVHGISDPILLQSFQLNDPNKLSESFRYRFELGTGIKVPLGKTDKKISGLMPNLDLQAGTGSWDILTMLNFIASWKTVGFSANVNFKVNGRNADQYKYGNTVNSQIKLFCQTKYKNFSFMPLIGLYNEVAFSDISTIKHEDTGGHATFLLAGLYVNWKNLQIFGEVSTAILNRTKGYTQLINKNMINTGLIYYI